jgi:hypothetical protein
MRLSAISLLAFAGLAIANPLEGRDDNSKNKQVSTHPQVSYKKGVCTIKVCPLMGKLESSRYLISIALLYLALQQPNGGARDDSSALLYAFNELCSKDSTIELPGYYVVDKVLNTTLNNVEINLSGAIQYTLVRPETTVTQF